MKSLPAIVVMLALPPLTTAASGEFLRSEGNVPTVWIFKDADALRRFNKLKASATNDDGIMHSLATCKAPQGSKIEVRGSGHRTAFVRVVGGNVDGCEGTVPLGYVKKK